ncbi:SDR family oxidoreductase [Flammeovirgaceae bacterium SG7u.111]|nr:SDR family oxidoreductase [Flammeovirgaceae bacterium SG7u.132]WPO34024.1 SDR family oxidoreductase [Flammeovirgaceae bacterium SG7u.111]
MKILFIGGTGNISAASTRLAIEKGYEVYLFNRGNRPVPEGAKSLVGDITDLEGTKALLKDHYFDVVANFIAFTPEDVQRDIELFKGKTDQYIFISSASAYEKPASHPVITESTPLKNPYWQYSRDKIACEDLLNKVYREEDFPMTIVRPSLTYDTVIPVAIGSWEDFTIIDRIRKGKPIIIHGDGSSLWTITHSDDFAIGFVGLLGHQQAIGHSFHITSDEILTWNQIYDAVGAAAGVTPKVVYIPSDFIAKFDDFQKGNLLGDKAVSVVFDNTKIKSFVPEFKATIPFKVGIKRTVKWFEQESSRMKIIEENNQFMDKVIAAYQK